MDIAKAYNTPISNMIVEYKVNPDGIDVIYEYNDQTEHQITYRFVSDYLPIIKDGVVSIQELQFKCDKKMQTVIEKVTFKGKGEIDKTAYTVDFIADKKKTDKVCFNFLIND